MAITKNSDVKSHGMPSAPIRTYEGNFDLDDDYPDGGYPLTAYLPGATVTQSNYTKNYDGSALRWFRIVNVSGVATLKAYADTNGAPGTEVSASTDLVGHTGLVVGCIWE